MKLRISMRLTRKLVGQINAACNKACRGRRQVEVGYFTWKGRKSFEDGANFLLRGDDSDLDETLRVDSMIGTIIPGDNGWVGLDCYCYKLDDDGEVDELDGNVYVLISPAGEIAYASQDDMGHEAAIRAIIHG